MQSATNAAWSRWKAFAHRIGSFQARLLLTIVYFTLVVPFASILRLTSHPFRTPGWRERELPTEPESVIARRLF